MDEIIYLIQLIYIFVLVSLSYLFVFVFKELKDNPSCALVYCVSITIRHIVAFVNSNIFIISNKVGDAITTHEKALIYAANSDYFFAFDYQLYNQIVAIHYSLLGSSKYFMHELNVFLFSLSCVILLKIHKLLFNSKMNVIVFFFLVMNPFHIFLYSIMLREIFIYIFLMSSIYYFLCALKNKDLYSLCLFFVFAILCSLFHKAMILYIYLFYLPFLTLYLCIRWKNFTEVVFIISLSMLITVFVFFVLGNAEVSGSYINSIAKFELFEIYKSRLYVQEQLEFNADYAITLSESKEEMPMHTPYMLAISYYLSPYPWQIRNIYEFIAFVSNHFNFLLAIPCFLILFKKKFSRISGLKPLIVVYLTLSLMWSLGTFNYGTSVRRHIIQSWISYIVAFYYFKLYFIKR